MDRVCSYDNAVLAYQKARKGKRYREEVLAFEADREENLERACRDLRTLSYTPGQYRVFKVWEPKERTIMALPFYDRLIQHMVVNVIEPIFEQRFIYHSYACRKDKGAHKASDTLNRWIYNLEVIGEGRIHVVKGDIHSYFQSIDHRVLKEEIRRYIRDRELLVIIDRIIDHNGILPDGIGIPVGNLTSQLFANVYLNMFDRFVKHTLHAEYYMRYADDFRILSDDLGRLREWLDESTEFLNGTLKLELNPKTGIVAASNGVDFIGYRHYGTHKKVRKRSIRKLNGLIRQFEEGVTDITDFEKSYKSRIGHMKHADTYRLRTTYDSIVENITKVGRNGQKKDGV
jgi:retron-type reverse transcriptase